MRPLPLVSLFLLATATAHAGPSVKALTKQFRRLDSNKDESLSGEELGKVLSAKLTKNGALAETQAEMFAWFDEDASEGIDLSEWIAGRNADGSDSSPNFTDEVQDELDANGNGKLVWKEFKRVIHKYVSAKTARRWFDEWCTDYSSTSYGASYSLSDWTGGLSVTLVGPDTANTYTGSTTVSGGSLSIAHVSGGISAGGVSFTDLNAATLTLSSADTGGTTVFSGVSGSGVVATAPNSTLTLEDSTFLTLLTDVTLATDDTVVGLTQTNDFQSISGGTFTIELNTFTGWTTVETGTLQGTGELTITE